MASPRRIPPALALLAVLAGVLLLAWAALTVIGVEPFDNEGPRVALVCVLAVALAGLAAVLARTLRRVGAARAAAEREAAEARAEAAREREAAQQEHARADAARADADKAQRESDDQQSGHRTAVERNAHRRVPVLSGGERRTHIG